MELNAVNAIGVTGYVQTPSDNKPSSSIQKRLLFSFNNSQQPSVVQKQEPVKKPKEPTLPVEPEAPEFDGDRVVRVQKGWTVETLAKHYNISTDELMKYNPSIKTIDDKITGKKLKIPYRNKQVWEEYQSEVSKYNSEMNEYHSKMELYEKSMKSYEVAQKILARSEYENKNIEVSINPSTGNLRIKVKGKVTFGSLRQNLGIKGGRIRELNPHIEQNYKPVRQLGITNGIRMENNWDLVEPKPGEYIELPPEDIRLDKTYHSY